MDSPPEDSRVPVWADPAHAELVQAFSDFCDARAESHLLHSPQITQSSREGAAESTQNSFVRMGMAWRMTYGPESAIVTNLTGVRCLAELVKSPDTQIFVLDLVTRVRGTETTSAPIIVERYSEILDAQARSEIRAEASRLQAILNDANELGDDKRASEVRAEIEALNDSVRGARGLGGKSRAFGDSVERARQTTHSNVRRAYDAIRPQAPALAAHLRQAIKISAYCSYTPVPATRWSVTKRTP
jgi:hypothetical protein